MWNGKKISIVIPAYNEEEVIRHTVEEVYREIPADEVIVVNNNSKDRTAEEISKTKARAVFEKRQGYGFAVQKGFREASGDLVVLFDADGNFPTKDIFKLLAYAEDFDFVKGTRSRKELVQKGIFSPFISWVGIIANIIVAKMQQLLFWGPVLTDAGCSLRLIKKSALKTILPHFTVGGAYFLVDYTNLAILAKIKTIEIPVRFTKRRGGQSKYRTHDLVKVALKMVWHTLKQRVQSWAGHYQFD